MIGREGIGRHAGAEGVGCLEEKCHSLDEDRQLKLKVLFIVTSATNTAPRGKPERLESRGSVVERR